MKNSKLLIFLVILSVTFTYCQNTGDTYQEMVKKELAKEVRNDSLFLGYYFGMPQKEFFAHSWELNKTGVITNGSGAQIKKEELNLKSPATMTFYPVFKNGKIFKMPINYMYDAWAPWNRELWADSLKNDLRKLYEKRYNGEFFEYFDPKTEINYLVQVSGNREIRISEKSTQTVQVLFTDLSQVNIDL